MNKNNIIDGFLTDLTNKENIYLLGYMWADGHLSKYNFSLELKQSDFLNIKALFIKNGITRFYSRQRYRNNIKFGSMQESVHFGGVELIKFLEDNDYKDKSIKSPTKILDLISPELHYLFWRGYFDGDGCLYIGKSKRSLAFWGNIIQDWSSLLKLINELKINYKFIEYSRKNGKHKSSCIEICRVNDIKLFLSKLYYNREIDNLGLDRKYNKYLEFKNIQIREGTSKYKYICFCPSLKENKWRVMIESNKENLLNKRIHVGDYDNEENALIARNNKLKELNITIEDEKRGSSINNLFYECPK